MGTTRIPGLDVQFNVQAGLISGGFDGLLSSTFSRGDVLIFSDVNHSNSGTMNQDMLSEQKLNQYSSHGVTDIYLEQLEEIQPLVDALARGEITEQNFVDEAMSISTNSWISEEENRASKGALASAITQGAASNPPINFHAVQIANTSSQAHSLSTLDQGIWDTHGQYLERVNELIDDVRQHTDLTEADRDFLFNGGMGESFIGHNGPQFEYSQILEHFGDRVPHDVLQDAVVDMYDLKINQLQMASRHAELTAQFRVDNDSILAERIADTRDRSGTAVVIHGSGHGATRGGWFSRDLDEILRHEYGLKNARVNVVYDGNDINSNAQQKDDSEISYFPDEDKVVAHDTNGNGEVEGAQGYTFGRFPGQ